MASFIIAHPAIRGVRACESRNGNGVAALRPHQFGGVRP
jgi:hypothetical protein